MKKLILTLGLCLFYTLCFPQLKDSAAHKLLLSVQAQQSVTSAPYSQVSALFGFTSNRADQFGIGAVARTYYTGYQRHSYGVTAYGQSGVLYPLIMAVKFDVLYGTWYKEYDLHWPGNVVQVKDYQGFASLTFSYPVSKNLYLGAEINSAAYNPGRFFKDNKEPFNWFGAGVSLKYDIPFIL